MNKELRFVAYFMHSYSAGASIFCQHHLLTQQEKGLPTVPTAMNPMI
jgi:hypothetical protein